MRKMREPRERLERWEGKEPIFKGRKLIRERARGEGLFGICLNFYLDRMIDRAVGCRCVMMVRIGGLFYIIDFLIYMRRLRLVWGIGR